MAHLGKSSAQLIARVRRIGGQVNAVERSLEGEATCSEILQLVAAVRGAVNGLMDEIIIEHLDEHVAAPGLSEDARAQAAEELKAVIRRYTK
ncbi:metal/formaldehyde-sensitive transcriptional repressor [Sphingobium sufflavum]|uniref:metal/formaldehyde-sensitive transcriptional repressor n=1 Tax=Sphingobium sufflavum TaxID=1129547 RepID=UPI001F18B207|nr:metal/formaldehyde-sensitive transcriptional repressor [Sphingobium sufflavum]MCE7798082.1 metal/formaldehyde-sensitive transcriptional repressor [Sphingobium sufflavum]